MSGVLRSMRPLARRLQGKQAVGDILGQQRRCMAGDDAATMPHCCHIIFKMPCLSGPDSIISPDSLHRSQSCMLVYYLGNPCNSNYNVHAYPEG